MSGNSTEPCWVRIGHFEFANDQWVAAGFGVFPATTIGGVKCGRQSATLKNLTAWSDAISRDDRLGFQLSREKSNGCLTCLDALFDFFYVQPQRLTAQRAALNAKLAEAGKSPMK